VRKPSSTGLGAAQERESSVATTSDRTSNYAGAQVAITTEIARNTLQAGLYSFGQHDNYVFGAIFNDGSGLCTGDATKSTSSAFRYPCAGGYSMRTRSRLACSGTAERLAWFEEQLQKPRTTPFLAHHPVYSNGPHGDHLVLARVSRCTQIPENAFGAQILHSIPGIRAAFVLKTRTGWIGAD
jgi:hypothetical protein